MKKSLKRLALFLILALLLPAFSGIIPSINGISHAEAAAKKAKLVGYNNTIGIASTPEYLYVENRNEKATYTFSSKDKKIATVNKYGNVTGVAIGKTTITLKETYKKKTTTIGTYVIKVVNSSLDTKEQKFVLYNKNDAPILYKNLKAKYTYTISDPTILKVEDDGTLRALKTGTSTVTVQETYKKVTRSLGTFSAQVIVPTIAEKSANFDIPLNASVNTENIEIENSSWGGIYSYESGNPSIVEVATATTSWGDNYYTLKGISLGTTQISVYLEYNGEKVLIGTVNATVKEIPVTEFKLNKDYLYKDEDNNLFTYAYLSSYYTLNLKDYLVINPANTSTPVTFTSEDESVATVDANGDLKTVKAGKTTVTATCGSFTEKIIIYVE